MMDFERIKAIEIAALNAWPAPRQILYDNWLLRFTGGESKRVNSVNVLGDSSIPLAEKIRFCEGAYAHQGLPAIYRLPDPFTSNDLRHALLEEGYVPYDPTFVLGRQIELGEDLPNGVSVKILPIEDWLVLRSWITDTPLVRLVHHAAVLNIIASQKALMGIFVGERPVACGMGVVEGKLLGYFSIYTRESDRRHGFGRAMMTGLTRWGAENGATYGYLQVEGYNTPALKFYDQIGFENCYQYMYSKREKDPGIR